MQHIDNTTYNEIAHFLGGLTADVSAPFTEWGVTTERSWATKRSFTDKQLTWIATTAKFQRKTIPASMLALFPELLEVEIHKARKPSTNTTPEVIPQRGSNGGPAMDDEAREAIAVMLSDMAAAMLRAANTLRLQ